MAAIPTATYRLQLTHRFGFADAANLVPYLAELGVSDLYCSPILKARTGSEHCYDVTDPTQINSQLGGEAAFDSLSQRLRSHGMGLLLDIVPNHMAVSPENAAWMNVLEYGPASPFADWFDIAWHTAAKPEAVQTGVLLPILGKQLEAAIADGEVTLQLEGGRFIVRYFDWTFPVNARSLSLILQRVRMKVPAGAIGNPRDAEGHSLDELAARIERLPPWQEASGATFRQACEDIKRQLAVMLERDADLHARVDAAIAEINAKGGGLDELLHQQVYRLRHWKTAAKQLTYRRFFDITDLIGVSVEHRHVFQQTHKLILRLLQMGRITGLRIDHIDGLADPATYLETLQCAARYMLGDVHSGNVAQAYVLVEKILEAGETLDEAWPVSGTTGYEFLNAVNEVFVDGQGLKALGEHQAQITGVHESFTEVVRRQKARVANDLFGSEVNALLRQLNPAMGDMTSRVTEDELRDALISLSAELPVYRTYAQEGEFSQRDRALLLNTFGHLDDTPGIQLLRNLLLLGSSSTANTNVTEAQREARQRFILRWQQFTGPLMAKGLEDTSLYHDTRLISLNEVGMQPQVLDGQPRGIDDFHKFMQARADHWPHSMNATATHDTKRGEDARARINVLSEMPQQWIDISTRWMALSEPWKTAAHQRPEQVIPDPRTELFLYQSALGMWPLSPQEQESAVDRLEKYARKAAREAKLHTSWLAPDEAYEHALSHFVRGVFDPQRQDEFAASFNELHQIVAWYGAMNSLSQSLIKFAAPGVPDLYQGCELWDLSLVDPDNRRAVDFDRRRRILGEIDDQLPGTLLEHWRDGRIKFFLTHRALHARRTHSDLFLHGQYVPLSTSGEHADRILAFGQEHQGRWAIAAAPIMYTRLAAVEQPPIGEAVWRDTVLRLPQGAPLHWFNCLTDQPLHAQSAGGGDIHLAASEVFRDFPVALLVSH